MTKSMHLIVIIGEMIGIYFLMEVLRGEFMFMIKIIYCLFIIKYILIQSK